MRLNTACVVVATAVAGGILQAQTSPPPPRYKFEAASIKPSKSVDISNRFGAGPQGGLRAENVTTGQLISFAYGVRNFQVVGAPKWVLTDRYDVLATPERPEESPSPTMPRDKMESFLARLRQRVQAMLAERYGLVIKEEMREMPVYSLVVTKGGHKLTKSLEEKPPNMSTGRGVMRATGANMKMLCDGLSGVLFHPVIDDTGLEGLYDMKMEWTPEPRPGDAETPESGGPSIFSAIQEQLGLRLEAKKAPATVFVVEKIDRPSEN